MLTAQEVEQKTFSTALRGYDLDEVDDFLDEIVATLKDLNEQLEEARSSQAAAPVAPPEPVVAEPEPAVEEPEPEPEPAPVPVAEPTIDESAVGRALIAAQTAADQLLADAESQASRIVDDARQQADTWESEKEAKKAEAQAEMANLAERVRAVRSELTVLAEQVSGNLDDMDSTIASSGIGEAGDEGSDDGGDEANQVAVLDAEESNDGEVETGSDDTDTANGADHLDLILTGVATDLQLGESGDDSSREDEEYQDDEYQDEEHEGDEHEDAEHEDAEHEDADSDEGNDED